MRSVASGTGDCVAPPPPLSPSPEGVGVAGESLLGNPFPLAPLLHGGGGVKKRGQTGHIRHHLPPFPPRRVASGLWSSSTNLWPGRCRHRSEVASIRWMEPMDGRSDGFGAQGSPHPTKWFLAMLAPQGGGLLGLKPGSCWSSQPNPTSNHGNRCKHVRMMNRKASSGFLYFYCQSAFSCISTFPSPSGYLVVKKNAHKHAVIKRQKMKNSEILHKWQANVTVPFHLVVGV